MTDTEIDELATRFAARVTEGFVELMRQHEEEAHDSDYAVSWPLRGFHSVAIQQAAADLIRALDVQGRNGG